MSRTTLTAAEQGRLRRTARRLGLQTALLVLGCLVVVGTLVVLVVTQSQREAGARLLESTARSVDDVRDVPAGVWVALDGPRGLEVSPGMPDGLPDTALLAEVERTGADRWTRATHDGDAFTVLTARSRAGAVQVVLDPHESHEEMQRLVTALVAGGGVGVLLAGLGGGWLGRRAVRPTIEALALQRRFVADASHELRTPLTLLTTRAQLLRRHVRAEPALPEGSRLPADVDGLVADAGALTSVLEDMLVAADARSADRAEADVALVAAGVVEAASASADARGLALVLDDGPPVVADVSAVSVRRAVTALVDNALDHAAQEVRVQVRSDGADVLVVVEDDGPGLASGGTDLFERFASRRVARPDDESRRHYGLGLALVAEVAAQHGGSVDAGPVPATGAGTAVRLRLPARGPGRRPTPRR